MSLEKTLVILKPSAVQRGLIGEITTRFERKGLRLAGMKMMQLTDELLNEHYAHLSEKPFFQRVKNSMMASPVIVCCYEGVDAIQVVRSMTGAYWYGDDEKKDRRRDIRFIKGYFPQTRIHGIPKMAHAELVMVHPGKFCRYAEKFLALQAEEV